MPMHELAQTVARFSDAGPIHPIVIQSWQRSRAAGLNREAPPNFRRVPSDDLQSRQSANRLLLDIAIPHLRWLSRWFQPRSHVAYVVDKQGIVLHAEGDPNAIARFNVSPGYDWSESSMGTNGAGTALASGVPVAVIGCDHWSVAWKDATCLGAPILGRDRTPVGAIDISMDVHAGDAERLVVAAHVAHTISQELARYEAEARNRATEELYEAVRTALDAEQRARGEAEAALSRARDAEAALQESQARLSLALDNSGMGTWELNLATDHYAWSEQTATLFGLPRSETSGPLAQFLELLHPDDREAVREANQSAAAGVRSDVEFRAIWPDGTLHWINGKGQVGPTTDGAGLRLIGICQDVTERKRLMSALELAQRQKDAIIATVAHELRQPLGAIRAAVALMQTRTSREKGERARTIVERQVQQLARMVEDLLDAARIAQGKVTLRRKRTVLNAVIDAAVSTVQPLVWERGQHLDVDMPGDALWLDADAARLQQVFSNLLTNASKFTEAAGRITVSVEPTPETVAVSVRDTGQGIAAETLPHIFDLFNQAAPDARGLGIGLALVRELVERHGGTVEAFSEGPGSGSEFVVRLPRVSASV